MRRLAWAAAMREEAVALRVAAEKHVAGEIGWEAYRAAREAGLRVKINAVALKGFNEDELFDLDDVRFYEAE